MPRKFKVSKVNKKKKNYKVRSTKGPLAAYLRMLRSCRLPKGTSVFSSLANFPINTVARLRYSDTAVIDGAIIQNFTIRANDIFDPQFTAGGHSPMGYQQWISFYYRWVVVRATIVADFTCSEAGSGTFPDVCILNLSDNASLLTPIGRYQEQGNCKIKQISGANGTNGVRLKMSYTPHQFYKSYAAVDNVALQGQAGASPILNNAYFNMAVSSADAATHVTNVYVTFTVTYDVLWLEPIQLTQSGI